MLLGLIFSCMAQPGTSESSCECDADSDSDADTDTDTDSDADTDTDVAPLTVGVPAYFYPGDLWAQASLPGGGILVMNPASGPGTEVNADYVAAVGAARAAGMKVLGYVHTSYGARQASLVEADIDAYAAWYSIDGVFFDEVPGLDDCAGQRALYEGYATRVRGLDRIRREGRHHGQRACSRRRGAIVACTGARAKGELSGTLWRRGWSRSRRSLLHP